MFWIWNLMYFYPLTPRRIAVTQFDFNESCMNPNQFRLRIQDSAAGKLVELKNLSTQTAAVSPELTWFPVDGETLYHNGPDIFGLSLVYYVSDLKPDSIVTFFCPEVRNTYHLSLLWFPDRNALDSLRNYDKGDTWIAFKTDYPNTSSAAMYLNITENKPNRPFQYRLTVNE
jgi:hypothetical protein